MRHPLRYRSAGAGSPKLLLVLGGAVVAVLIAVAIFSMGGKGTKSKPAPKANIIPILPPPPPPPPPTPPPPPPPDQAPPPPDAPEFVEEKAPDSPPEPEPDAPAPMGSNIEGDGPPDGFGLVGKGGGGLIGGRGKGGGGGSQFGWYAGRVQSAVSSALRSHRATKSSSMSVKARIWVDSSGRVTRAALEGSSGDRAVDEALQNEILVGIRLPDAPPEGMPMPIVMRINAARP